MKIAIIGYGKMGRLIEKIARRRGHEITAIIDRDNQQDFDSPGFRDADVAIEFSQPSVAQETIRKAWERGLPVVSGTTGWLTPLAEEEIRKACGDGATLMHATNFSIGVNVAMAANRLLARLLDPHESYRVRIEETHHIHKLDHPSGTAITLADDIIRESSRMQVWIEPGEEQVTANSVPVYHKREGEVPGTHVVSWESPVDTITLRHKAKSREGFALGAVVAAEWLNRQPAGHLYTMSDMLGF